MALEFKELGFESLNHIDEGRVAMMLKYHLQRIAQDCISRPWDKTPRKVTLEFTAKPVMDDQGHCSTAKIEIEGKSKVPVHRTKAYEMNVSKAGFLFNADFPDSVDQPSLFPDGQSAEGKEGGAN